MMFRHGLLAIILIMPVAARISTAQSPHEQIDPVQRYQSENTISGTTNDVEKYVTPEVYPEQGGDAVDQDIQSEPIGESGKEDSPTDRFGLKSFGYDLFGGSPESFSPIMEATPPPDYKLGPGDHVLVNVWGRVDMQLELTIDREGKIFIPKVGEIIAWGLTMDEFKSRLNDAMSSAYSDYELSVSLGKIRRIKVFVYGEVKKPGGYTLSSLATLFNALHMSGGASENGSLRSIKHIRHNKILSEIDLYKFLLTGDNSQDAELQSGDVIFVPVVGPKVSIRGEVKRPAIYELMGNERISDLIDLAGGANAESYLNMVEVDRIGSEDSRILLTADLSGDIPDDANNLVLADGDHVRIPSVFDSLKNIVALTGHVKHPGMYELIPGMRVSDLIDCGEMLLGDSYLERANLFRTYPDLTREVCSVNLEKVIDGDEVTDYLLMDNDSLVVYSQKQIRREMKVSISGSVKNPGTYEYFNDMRLSDLVFLAGNPNKQAYTLRAEIARVNPGNPADMIYVNLEEALDNRGSESDIPLLEDDIVYIRTIPGWRLGESVTIDGEVNFPGRYSLIRENERLLDLLDRCGGVTRDAFLEGLVFRRNSIVSEVKQRQAMGILNSTEEVVLDSLSRPMPKLNPNVDLNQLGRIVIDVDRLMKNKDSQDNIVLRNGDYIYVPPKPSGVQVLGAVASSGTIAFKKGKKPDFFVDKAGGFTPNAAKGELRLVKADGRIYAGRNAKGERVEAGDLVIVPFKIKKDRQWFKTAVSAMGIITSLATTVLVIDRLN